MNTTLTIPDNLKRIAIESKFVSQPGVAWLSDSYIESDSRERPRVIADLISAGLVAQKQEVDRYYLTDAMEELTPVEPVSLMDLWDRRYCPGRSSTWHPYIRTVASHGRSSFCSPGELRHLYEIRDELNWFSASSYVLDNNNGRLVNGNNLFGPANFDEALDKTCHERVNYWEMVATSTELREHVKMRLRQARLDEAYPKNFGYGLAKLEIITDAESEFIGNGTSSGLGGRSNYRLYLGIDPGLWPTKVELEMDHAIAQIAALHSKLVLLRKIQAGVERLGGWDVVREGYRVALEKELDSQPESE